MKRKQPANVIDNTSPLDTSDVRVRKKHPIYDFPSKQSVPLCTVEHIPLYRRVPFIFSGYRGYEIEGGSDEYLHNLSYSDVYYPVSWCFRSLFKIHNETINIWSHLVPGFAYLYFALQYMKHIFDPAYSHKVAPMTIIVIYMMCSAATLLGSAFFHWFNPVSCQVHYCLRVVDFTGISFLVIGSQWPLLWQTFFCDTTIYSSIYTQPRSIFMVFLILLGLFGTIFPFFRVFHTPQYQALRVTIFVLMATTPLYILSVALLYSQVKWSNISFLYLSMLETDLIYLVGLFFYVTRFPERRFPGKFDIWFSSHQIWHCICAYNTYLWLSKFTSFMDEQTC